MCRLKITEMDLSMTEINTNTLERIIGCCTRLESLSLSGMKLSCAILLGLSYNRRLRQLNLSGCHGFAAPSLGRTLRSCSRSLLRPALHRPSAASKTQSSSSSSFTRLSPSCRIQHLNMSGCPFNHPIAKSIFNNVSSTVTALDLSGKYCYSSLDGSKGTAGKGGAEGAEGAEGPRRRAAVRVLFAAALRRDARGTGRRRETVAPNNTKHTKLEGKLCFSCFGAYFDVLMHVLLVELSAVIYKQGGINNLGLYRSPHPHRITITMDQLLLKNRY
ncbi:uncharacterized protein LOC133401852 isoform X4 [Phycodurus eques]|uniref:uncharacterized protein LOC133401852 isoform X4 n=1 Tax=Phycodurus eques TaxID=693459 RepID=UPI002ACD6569|nr:uncharacterized protein LOC133401852 isoform X4 [Phycodurus eques]